jgi:large subunit ribosomal protein L21
VHAIVQSGGKQYRVSPGDTLRVEKLIGQKGETVELPRVLYYAEGENILVGNPFLSNVKVTGEILDQRRAKKVIIFKKKRRKGYCKRQGHRQSLTTLRIKDISVQ